MPTTYSLAILSLIALFGLSGCNGSQPSRSAIDTNLYTLSTPGSSESSETAGQLWQQDPLLQGDTEATPTRHTWFLLDPYMPEEPEATLTEETWQQPSDSADRRSTPAVNTLADADIWTRIRLGFQLPPLHNARIKRQLEWYHAHPEHLPGIEEQARPYLYFIVEELEMRGLPTELALLPAIESAFKPSATGPQSAAGIWQIMPETGKMLGLEQNWWYDGRRDVIAATEAALDYLESLSAQFEGDWELALAAYNSGEGTVRKAIKKNQELGKPTDYWSLDLPRTTRGYLSKLMALARVVEKPEAFGTRLTSIPNQPYFDSVNIEANLNLVLAAQMADLSVDELYKLNPGFKRVAIATQDSHRLVLPVENIEQFKENLAGMDQNKQPRNSYIMQPGDKTIYTVRSGDSLWTIAQDYNVDYKSLAQWNGLTLGDSLRPGQKLIILNENIVAEASARFPEQRIVR